MMSSPTPKLATVPSLLVATTSGCPHCKRVKDALTTGGFDYAVVDMSAKPPSALVALKRETGLGTVPQVFVGGRLVGGADETVGLIEDGGLRRLVDALGGSGVVGGAYEPGVAAVLAVLFGGQDENDENDGDSFLDELMCLRRLREGGSVSAASVMAGLEAARAEKMVDFGVVVRGAGGRGMRGRQWEWSEDVAAVDAAAFRRFGKRMPLNGHLPPNQDAKTDQDPVLVSARLRTLLLALFDDHLASGGSAVDYAGLRRDPRFRAYVDLSASLDAVDLSLLTTKEAKLAFWINAYNSLIVHALTVVGPAETTLQRLTWFGRVAYRIGGNVFSADDIEHGVLRGNASPPASFLNLVGLKALAAAVSPAFGPSDPRRAHSLARDEVDPRIHFALNCGAKSCPAIKVYSAEVLEDGLAVGVVVRGGGGGGRRRRRRRAVDHLARSFGFSLALRATRFARSFARGPPRRFARSRCAWSRASTASKVSRCLRS